MVNSLAPVSPHLCGRARDAFGGYRHACVTPVLYGLMDDLAPEAQDIRDIAEVGLESWEWMALSYRELAQWADEECVFEVSAEEYEMVVAAR